LYKRTTTLQKEVLPKERTSSLGITMAQPVLPRSTHMGGPYNWFNFDDDPDDIFLENQVLTNDIADLLQAPTPARSIALDKHLTEDLVRVVFGSNLIESAGASLDVTSKLCTKIFQGEQITEEIAQGGVREVVQHAHALSFIIDEMVIQDKPLTEEVILEAHKILTYKVDASGGDKYTEYGGVYRNVSVGAGFTPFTAPKNVPAKMHAMVADFNRDIDAAFLAGHLDPYMLAAKYCHKFVNIHPFVDGNGRTCRLILNAIMLKHAGIVVPLGETESDCETYLSVACRGSESQQIWDGEDSEENEYQPAPWSELAYLVLVGANEGLKNMKEAAT
jgi:Fic family protein